MKYRVHYVYKNQEGSVEVDRFDQTMEPEVLAIIGNAVGFAPDVGSLWLSDGPMKVIGYEHFKQIKPMLQIISVEPVGQSTPTPRDT